MKRLAYLAILVSAGSLTAGYGWQERWLWLAIIVALALVWLLGEARQLEWVTSIGLVGQVGLAGYGVRLGVGSLWLLVAITASLAAWDLIRFERRMGQAAHINGETQLRRSHLRRLGLILGGSLLGGGVALSLSLPLNFGWAVLLALLLGISLSRLVRLVNR